MSRSAALYVVLALLLPACAPVQPLPAPTAAAVQVDSARLITDISVLAADSMEGRLTGTPGSERARRFIRQRFQQLGLTPFGDGYEHRFTFTARQDTLRLEGTNLVGYIRGTAHPDRYLVVTAHYDHLGVRNGQIYNGADDNASGTAALLSLIAYFQENRPRHSVIFAALDAEEMGLQGAHAFVNDPPVARERFLMNINMDMISRNDRNELYAVGTYHYPFLRPFVERVAARSPISLLMGHDTPDLPRGEDWTHSSDHGAFHAVGIPFIYFGVEDHPDYHRPTDVFENIQPAFYHRAVGTVLDFILEVDRAFDGRVPAQPAAASTSSSSRAASFAVLPS